MTNFCSDNVSGAAPEIIEALAKANAGPAMPYGNDDWTRRVEARLQQIFETDCRVFPVATGTAANVLGLSLLTPPYGAVYCHEEAHVNIDECGAPEFYTGGAKLVALPGPHGKLSPEALAAAISGAGNQHRVQPAAISLSQATEAGTVYRPKEVAAIAEVARAHGLGLQMDGARFANALVSLGCTPAEITWKAGVDALSFGATKNGAMAAEAVVLFRPELAESLPYRRKQGGHLFSKMRFLSAQLEAYLEGDLWLALAARANASARRLADGLAAIPGACLVHPVEANEIFCRLPEAMIDGLLADGFQFYRWGAPAASEVRLVCAFERTEAEVDAFLAAARHLAGTADAAAASA
ncbi:MAG: low specificity L-threonine aldolase [Kiloniellales bacterium]